MARLAGSKGCLERKREREKMLHASLLCRCILALVHRRPPPTPPLYRRARVAPSHHPFSASPSPLAIPIAWALLLHATPWLIGASLHFIFVQGACVALAGDIRCGGWGVGGGGRKSSKRSGKSIVRGFSKSVPNLIGIGSGGILQTASRASLCVVGSVLASLKKKTLTKLEEGRRRMRINFLLLMPLKRPQGFVPARVKATYLSGGGS